MSPGATCSSQRVSEGAESSLARPRAVCVQGSWVSWQSPGRRLLGFPRPTAGCLQESESSRHQFTPAGLEGNCGRQRWRSEGLGLRTPTGVSLAPSGRFYQDLSLPDLILE